ncbi:MAG: Stk1 family PASTA domain-containing Ser/Thr kinase [Armatimonadota bacterium]
MIGTVIAGRYRLEEQIGDGGVATVYRGTDVSLQRPVAVKILREEHSDDSEVVERFRREARAAAKLNHPNIVQIYDTGSDDGIHYIIMEYLPEPDFKHIINEYAPLPARKVLQVAIECCGALSYAHRNGLVHRDVKPHNVLFTDDGHAKLSDFGIAAAVGERGTTSDGMVLGSAQYISPEQAQGRAAGPQSDLYSLGVVMYEALSGQLPFTGDSAAEIAAKHVRQKIPSLQKLNANISPSVEFVVNKALMRDLSRRYRSADDMLVDLQKLAEGVDLDRTGVLGEAQQEATVRLEASLEPETDADTDIPGSQEPPYSTPRPQTQKPPETGSNATTMALTIGAVVLATIALVAVYFLARSAFYPGHAPKNVQVPHVRGMSEAEAISRLQEAGLKVGNISRSYEDEHEPGTVIDQTPDVGTTVATATSVNLTVSKGKKEVEVVDVVGKHIDAAQAALSDAGLQVGAIEDRFSNSVPENHVISQGISPEGKVKEGTSVGLVVSKGPETEEEPDEEEPDEPTDEEAQRPPDPVVQITMDESYDAQDPAERRLIVRVTAQGTSKEQKIRIIQSDDTALRMEVENRTLGPGETMERPLVIVGNASVEIYHEGNLVYTNTFAVE